MNYIREINAFYDLLQYKSLSCGQIALWHALLSICNMLGWQEWFTAPSQIIEMRTGLTRNGVMSARNALSDRGFIEYKSRGTRAPMYRIVPSSGWPDTVDFVQAGVQDSVQAGVQDSVQAGVQLTKQKHKHTPPIVPPKGRTRRTRHNPAATDYQQKDYTNEELQHIFGDLGADTEVEPDG